jgi:glycopeptide antibiotics resistance protein
MGNFWRIAFTATYGLMLALALLWPRHIDSGGLIHAIEGWLLRLFAGWPPTRIIDYNVLEAGSNVLLFIPLGLVAVAWFNQRWWVVLSGSAVFSLLAEVIQLTMLPDRTFSWFDVVYNTTGSAIGVSFMLGFRKFVLERRRRK